MSFLFHGVAEMKRTPDKGWTAEDIIEICKLNGVRCVRPPEGSYYVISHHLVDGLLTLPAERGLKPFHVLLVVELLEAVIERKKWHAATKSSFVF